MRAGRGTAGTALTKLPHAALRPAAGIPAGSYPLFLLLAADRAVVLQARPLQRAVAAAS